MAQDRTAPWRIGLDLDNTLVNYDSLFIELAQSRGLVPPDFAGDKRQLRDLVRLHRDGETEWQRLQAQAYGTAILAAVPAAGASAFLGEARRRGIETVIVSHKTERAAIDPNGASLHEAARRWLRHYGVCGPGGVPEENVFFEPTRGGKIARIARLGCTHFIDDLAEVFDDPSFPPDVERILLSTTMPDRALAYPAYRSFDEILRALFRE